LFHLAGRVTRSNQKQLDKTDTQQHSNYCRLRHPPTETSNNRDHLHPLRGDFQFPSHEQVQVEMIRKQRKLSLQF